MSIEIIKSNPIYRKGYKWIVENSTSNTLPYHNINHLVSVFNSCYDASVYYKINDVSGTRIQISLCLAALFHDVNHSGGEFKDDENIKIAISTFSSFYNTLDSKYIDMFNKDMVISIIESTEYPYKNINNSDLSLYEKIIRDADLTSVFSDTNWIQPVIFGLKEEIGISTVEKRINQQVKFILTLKPYTGWGMNILEDCKGRLLNELANMKSILKDEELYVENEEIITIHNENVTN